MITYKFGENYENPHFGVFWRENKGDYPLYHTHNYWEFFIVKSGSFEHLINGKTQNLVKGDAVLLAPGDAHSLKGTSKDLLQLNIGIRKDVFEERCRSFSPTLFRFFDDKSPLKVGFSLERIKKIESLLKVALFTNDKSEQETIINFVLFNIFEPLFNDYLNQKSVMPDWFKNLLIQCNSIEHLDWKPRDACEYANYSQAHINRMFRQLLNTSLVEYLIDIKMNNSIILLTTTDMSLSEIVETLGYNSISYFTHAFKKYYNVTPYQYKINFKRKNKQ
ncbi:MAG: AraC family transcriptional regulator [Bacilli bacterium]|nr:AraC family transcriptional regulator [Bacilli bacterium]